MNTDKLYTTYTAYCIVYSVYTVGAGFYLQYTVGGDFVWLFCLVYLH